MTDQLWTVINILLTGGLTVLAESIRRGVKKSRDLVEPVSNGFAQDVRDGLTELKVSVAELSTQMHSHISDHVREGLSK